MKKLIYTLPLLFLCACVPDKVTHELKGNATTENIIKIEIVLPPELVKAYDTTCASNCGTDLNCKDKCNATQMSNYTNTILSMISQLNNTLNPPVVK